MDFILDKILKCSSGTCDGCLKRGTSFYTCDKCDMQYPIISGIPTLIESPEDYLSEYYKIFENELENEIKPADNDFPNITDIHKKRIAMMKVEIEPFLTPTNTSYSTYRYSEMYSKEMNNDEYILSGYAPFLENTTAYSECLYSTVLNLGVSTPSDGTMLEIGCGIGRTLLDYSYLLKDGNVIGVDLEYSKIRLAQEILKTDREIEVIRIRNFSYEISKIKGFNRPNIHLMVANADKLPFLNSIFDIIIISYLLGLLEIPKEFLKLIPSLLKDNGMLIIADDHGWYQRIRPRSRHTCPEMLAKAFEYSGLKKDLEFDTPYYESLTDRVYHIHLTRFTRYRKNKI